MYFGFFIKPFFSAEFINNNYFHRYWILNPTITISSDTAASWSSAAALKVPAVLTSRW